VASVAHRKWNNKDGTSGESHRVQFIDAGGKRRRRDFSSKKAAMAFLSNLSDNPVPQRMSLGNTFEDAMEAYLEACSSGRDGGAPLEALTLREYRRRLTQHILPHLGPIPVAKLTQDTMRDLRDKLAASGLARGSARKHLFLAKSVVRHAVYLGWLRVDPTTEIVIRADRRREGPGATQVEIHTREEMAAILKAAESMRPRYHTMIHTLVFCGLRMSELRGLPADGVDLEARTLKVYQRADMDGVIGPPKSQHGYRTLDLPDGVTQLLATWLGERVEGLAFPTDSGLPISHSNLSNRMWRPVQIKAGVTILNPHATRHFFASMLIHGGAKLKAVQVALGHHDPMFTLKTYGHLFTDPEDVELRREMARKMETSLAA
jgi:integrase